VNEIEELFAHECAGKEMFAKDSPSLLRLGWACRCGFEVSIPLTKVKARKFGRYDEFLADFYRRMVLTEAMNGRILLIWDEEEECQGSRTAK